MGCVMELTIAVVSDLHCYHSSKGHGDSLLLTDAPRLPSKQHPVSALVDLVKEEALRADVLLTGCGKTEVSEAKCFPRAIRHGY